MLFASCITTALAFMVTTAAAVDLRNYPQGYCSGSRGECRDINAGTCCIRGPNGSSTFRSGSCIANVKSHRHIIYRQSGGTECGQSWLGNNCGGDNCIADTEGRLAGHNWRQTPTREIGVLNDGDLCDAGDDGPSECSQTVKMDLLAFNRRAFELNGTEVTEQQKEQLWALFDEFTAMEAQNMEMATRVGINIPPELEAFEIPYYE